MYGLGLVRFAGMPKYQLIWKGVSNYQTIILSIFYIPSYRYFQCIQYSCLFIHILYHISLKCSIIKVLGINHKNYTYIYHLTIQQQLLQAMINQSQVIHLQPIEIRKLTFRQLLFELTQQYENNTFQINHSLRNAINTITGNQLQLKHTIPEDQIKQIQQQLTLFLLAFVKSPSVWAQLLKNDEISSETTKITINYPYTLTKVYNQVMKQASNLIMENKGKYKGYQTTKDQQTQQKMSEIQQYNFQDIYMDESAKNWMANLLNTLAYQICDFYKKGKHLIINQTNQVEEIIKSSQIMNPYYLFGILKQMSTYTYRKVEEEMSVYFKNLPSATIVNFCRYVQKNYQYVDLVCHNEQPKIYTKNQLEEYIDEQNQYWLNFLKNMEGTKLTLRRMQSNKGDNAVMIVKKGEDQNQEVFEDAEQLILKVGEDRKIRVMNSKISQKKWAIFDMKDSVSGLYKIMKQKLTDPSAAGKISKQALAYGVPIGQYANFGGSVGKCLADVNKYKSANAFLLDLSTSTVIGGGFTYALTQVPILQYFIIAGGLTYTFYHTFHNKTMSTKKKMSQLGKNSVTAVGSVGSAVAGMMIGQTLIPVPFLGAFVGGVIGGFLGRTGTNLMTTLMSKQSFGRLIDFLHEDMVEGRYWIYSSKLLDHLGIHRRYFNEQLCTNQHKKDAYITAICFCIVSFHQAKRYIARNEQKMKQLKHKKQKDEQQLLEEEEVFANEFDIVGIVDYLTEHNIVLLHEHERLQKCIQHFTG